jgi:hypothetical protein
MKRFLRLGLLAAVVAVAAVLVSPATGAVDAGPVVNPANGHSYYLISATSNWFAAEAEAVSLGGHLATDNDAAEHAWIAANIGPFVAGYPGFAAAWIGLNDLAVENNFVWVSGESTPFWGPQLTPVPGSGLFPWRASGEPNGGTGENCVYFDMTPGGGGWVDYPCTGGDALQGIVEVAPAMPTSKDQCKNNGWQSFGVFKNQGDCVSWIATHGKNPPSGP